jgi:signal transduction histidine kinase
VAAGALAAGLVLLALRTYLGIFDLVPQAPRVLFVVPLVVVSAALALRRMAPLVGLGIGVLALAADVALGGSLATILVFSQLLYEVCVYGPPWLWQWALRVSIVLTLAASAVAVVLLRTWQGIAVGVPFALVFVLSVVSAISVRQYRDQAVAERARAEQTARVAELDRRQAVTIERTRMARELHDLIANHLSAVAIHATALLSVRNLDQSDVDRALRVIRENSVQGLAEMRQMVELLRDPASADERPTAAAPPASQGPAAPDGTAAPARLSEAARLAERAREAGLDVDLTVAGHPRPLPVGVDLAAYRILQESLTNALKHGGGPAEVTVAYEPDRIALTVTNPMPRTTTAARAPGARAGLVGMRERAELLGGKIQAGPDHARSWRVHAELPAPEAVS